MQEEHQSLPDPNRLSVLSASILLAYSLLPFIQIPERAVELNLFGIVFLFRLNFATLTAIISAALAAAGTEWLLSDHPGRGSRVLPQHWLIPAMSAWVIGVPLSTLVVGVQWWAVFGFGGLLMVFVLVAEYITVDAYDTRREPAVIGLTAVSYALLLILIITLSAAQERLYVLIPAIMLAVFLVTIRSLYLRLGGRWYVIWSVGITLVVGQVAAAAHYLPLSPLRFGLLLLGLAYALASAAGSLEEGRPWRSVLVEPVVMLIILWGLALGLR